MTILETNTIDIISIDKDTGKVVLNLVDHLDWDTENKHLLLLQDKLNAYLHYLKSGEVYKDHSDFQGKKFVINVVFKNEPTPLAKVLLNEVKPVVDKHGFELRYETFHT